MQSATFFEHYKNLPDVKSKRDFRRKVLEACQIEHATFYGWIARQKVPKLAQTVLAKMLGRKQSELFPEKTN